MHFLVDVAQAEMTDPTALVDGNQNDAEVIASIRVVSAYNVGDPNQTDDTPCISANGEDICAALHNGERRCAANFVPLGTLLHVDTIGVCLVTDRTHRRFGERVDVAMQKHEYQKAIQFGLKRLMVKVLADL
jgi:hypothetical protein